MYQSVEGPYTHMGMGSGDTPHNSYDASATGRLFLSTRGDDARRKDPDG